MYHKGLQITKEIELHQYLSENDIFYLNYFLKIYMLMN